jgi:hypothetical protein
MRVIHCNPERIRRRFGCQFQEKLSWDALSAFG